VAFEEVTGRWGWSCGGREEGGIEEEEEESEEDKPWEEVGEMLRRHRLWRPKERLRIEIVGRSVHKIYFHVSTCVNKVSIQREKKKKKKKKK
jgi:hypothetical protein